MKKILGIIVFSFLLNIKSYAEKNIEIKFLGNEINFLDQDTKTHIKKIEGNPLDPEKAAKDQIEEPKVEIKEEVTPPSKKN